MSRPTPRFISFDCYGTLTSFDMSPVVRTILDGRLAPEEIETFINNFRTFRADGVLGEFQLYPLVLRDAWQRTVNLWRMQYRPEDVEAIITALGTWGPHPDVTSGLARLAEKYPLVIFSNAVDDILAKNVELLGVDFHRVFTAEQARAYKPRLAAFEYMFDQLDAGPQDFMHVSSHLWYDMLPARWLGITDLVYVNRGYDLEYGEQLGYSAVQSVDDLAGVADLLGL